MLRGRKREPFNFISPAPPRLSTPSSDEAPRKRSPSMFYERPRALLASAPVSSRGSDSSLENPLASARDVSRDFRQARFRTRKNESGLRKDPSSSKRKTTLSHFRRVPASRDQILLNREERWKRSGHRMDRDLIFGKGIYPSRRIAPLGSSPARLRSFYWVTPFLC